VKGAVHEGLRVFTTFMRQAVRSIICQKRGRDFISQIYKNYYNETNLLILNRLTIHIVPC